MSDDAPKPAEPAKRRRGHNEGSIHQRASDGRWVADLSLGYGIDGKRTRKRLYEKTRAEVNRKLQQAMTNHRDGLTVQTRDQTVGQYLAHWLKAAVKPGVRPRTYVSYEQICRVHLIPALGRHKLSKLNAQHIASYMSEKQSGGASGAAVNYHRSVLRIALNQAMRWDLVSRNVAALTQPRAHEAKEALPLSTREAGAFLRALSGDRLEALSNVALTLGLRQGEVLGLRWQDVDLEEGTLAVRHQLQLIPRVVDRKEGDSLPGRPMGKYEPQLVEPKTPRSRRTLPVPGEVLDLLRAHRRHQLEERLVAGSRWGGAGRRLPTGKREPWDLVFTSTIGTPLDPSNVTKDYKRILDAAKLTQRRYHDLRHSCASFLAARGVSQRVVMEILGHSQLSTTANIYTHIDADQLREATGRLSDLVPARSETS